jgi:hypothetical protein
MVLQKPKMMTRGQNNSSSIYVYNKIQYMGKWTLANESLREHIVRDGSLQPFHTPLRLGNWGKGSQHPKKLTNRVSCGSWSMARTFEKKSLVFLSKM